MKDDIKDILLRFNFIEDLWEEDDHITHHTFTNNTGGGVIEFDVFSNTLYIWSGMGLGSYTDSSERDLNFDNQCYGFEVVIVDKGQLLMLLRGLYFTDD